MKSNQPRVHTFGMENVESRVTTFKKRARAALAESKNVMTAAALAKTRLEARHYKYITLAEKLEDVYKKADITTANLRAKGKERLDSKRAKALIKRGLGYVCGVEAAETLVYCTNDTVELRELHWADEWVVELLGKLKKQINATEMSKFYDIIEKYKQDKDAIIAEAGLTILRKQ